MASPHSSIRRPRIGVTLDHEPAGGWSSMPWYAIRENYLAAVSRAGGLPVPLPHDPDLVDDWLSLIDGLLVTGGAFDLDPALYGAGERHATVTTKDRRTTFERAMTAAAVERDLPVFGICGGQQLLHVVLGGELIQHIPDAIADALAHEQPNPRHQPGHEVEVVPGTRLHAIVGTDRLCVNSAHHQAAGTAAPGVVVSARAPDGVIEAIEEPTKRFCIGVQWHPEYHISPGDAALFQTFVTSCRTP
jgi:putative glutamine amidotransferase